MKTKARQTEIASQLRDRNAFLEAEVKKNELELDRLNQAIRQLRNEAMNDAATAVKQYKQVVAERDKTVAILRHNIEHYKLTIDSLHFALNMAVGTAAMNSQKLAGVI
jgi:flagellar motility protein MotE (MotC chaperone)